MLVAYRLLPPAIAKNSTPKPINKAEIALIADSFWSLLMDNSPTLIEPSKVKRTMPHSGTQPIQTAKAAPAKPISDRVWAKNEKLLATTYTPTIPQVIAIKVLAKNAYRIKSYANIILHPPPHLDP